MPYIPDAPHPIPNTQYRIDATQNFLNSIGEEFELPETDIPTKDYFANLQVLRAPIVNHYEPDGMNPLESTLSFVRENEDKLLITALGLAVLKVLSLLPNNNLL
jgi:hypothetical protein